MRSTDASLLRLVLPIVLLLHSDVGFRPGDDTHAAVEAGTT